MIPYSRVVFTFGWEGEGNSPEPGKSTVEIVLTPDGEGTPLRLRHHGLSAEERPLHGQGWDQFVPRLAAVAEGREPQPAPGG